MGVMTAAWRSINATPITYIPLRDSRMKYHSLIDKIGEEMYLYVADGNVSLVSMK